MKAASLSWMAIFQSVSRSQRPLHDSHPFRVSTHAVSVLMDGLLDLQEQRQKAKGEKLAKIRAGEKGAVGSKPAEHTAISKKFYGQLVTDSHYVGDDYDVFGAWLGSKGKGTP